MIIDKEWDDYVDYAFDALVSEYYTSNSRVEFRKFILGKLKYAKRLHWGTYGPRQVYVELDAQTIRKQLRKMTDEDLECALCGEAPGNYVSISVADIEREYARACKDD